MQKWSPRPFTTVVMDPEARIDRNWRRDRDHVASASERLFRKDRPDSCAESVLELLTDEEHEMLRGQVASEFEAYNREQLAAERAERTRAFAAWLERCADEIKATTDRKLQVMARHTGILAISLAGRILRRHVQLDSAALTRALEVVLQKLEAGASLELRVNPQDAEFLAGQPELLQRLNITAVTPDRRIECGGCQVKVGEQLWDATLQGQLDSLAEVVEEIMACDPAPEE